MRLSFVLFSFCALLFSSAFSKAQREPEARLWLTTPDRSAVVAPQATPLHFSSEAGQLPVLTVDDAQHFQTIDGFGFALTGGSAQLLMRMSDLIVATGGAGMIGLRASFLGLGLVSTHGRPGHARPFDGRSDGAAAGPRFQDSSALNRSLISWFICCRTASVWSARATSFQQSGTTEPSLNRP